VELKREVWSEAQAIVSVRAKLTASVPWRRFNTCWSGPRGVPGCRLVGLLLPQGKDVGQLWVKLIRVNVGIPQSKEYY